MGNSFIALAVTALFQIPEPARMLLFGMGLDKVKNMKISLEDRSAKNKFKRDLIAYNIPFYFVAHSS
jgi:hypothetical protein